VYRLGTRAKESLLTAPAAYTLHRVVSLLGGVNEKVASSRSAGGFGSNQRNGSKGFNDPSNAGKHVSAHARNALGGSQHIGSHARNALGGSQHIGSHARNALAGCQHIGSHASYALVVEGGGSPIAGVR
jgi:hypothetical protein